VLAREGVAVRFGVFLLGGRFPGQNDHDALRRSMDAVICAESAGFDDAWIAEHHFMSYGTCPSAITFAGHALGQTSTIAVGTAVSVLSTTHPVALAEQTVLLDQLSGGRFHLGVGRGGPWVDLEVFGTGLGRYERGFAEGLDLLLQSLTQEQVAAAGEHFEFREVTMVPRPPSWLPVTVACTSRASVELAAARGLPMLLGMHIGDEEKSEMLDHYATAAISSGHDPRNIPHVSTVLAHVADSREQGVRELQSSMPGWLATGLAGHRPVDDRPPPQRDPHAYAELLCSLHPVGSPRECTDRLRSSVDRTGIQHVITMVEGSGDHERTLDNITRLGTEVLPELRR
jgi:alkanesulfonate monooxygenase SsuD/methylene tetrahydromethanopterin reductase-like flavin-dependent oxidoreductase (luciferase family)